MEEGQGEPQPTQRFQRLLAVPLLVPGCPVCWVSTPAAQAVMLHYPWACTSSAGLMHVWIINLGMKSAPCQGPLKSALKRVESKRTEEQGQNKTQGKDWILCWDACRRQKSGSWHSPRAAPEGSTQRSKQRTFGSTHEQELSKQKLFLHPLSFRT